MLFGAQDHRGRGSRWECVCVRAHVREWKFVVLNVFWLFAL